MKDWHKKPPARVRNSIMALADAERLRGDLPNVVQVYARDWDKVILADEIYRLRDWIREDGHRSNTCTYNVLGEICEGCKCGKDKRANDLGNRRAAFGASVLTDGLAGKT